MATFRISGPARRDLEHILTTSHARWGEAGRARYDALLTAALRTLARVSQAATTRDRRELAPDPRSFHIRHVRKPHGVQAPVHVIFYRATETTIEIVRVLHE